VCTSISYSENNRILSRRLKRSVLSIGSRRSSLSEFQAVGPVYLQMPDAHTSWDCVEAQRGNDAWQNENVDWPHPFQKSRRTERRTTRQTDRQTNTRTLVFSYCASR